MLKDAGRKADVAVFSTRERAQEMAALVGAEDEQDSDFPERVGTITMTTSAAKKVTGDRPGLLAELDGEFHGVKIKDIELPFLDATGHFTGMFRGEAYVHQRGDVCEFRFNAGNAVWKVPTAAQRIRTALAQAKIVQTSRESRGRYRKPLG